MTSPREWSLLSGKPAVIAAGADAVQARAVIDAARRTDFNILDYGATGHSDDTAAIQAAIDAASSAGGATVYLPTGTYTISATLTLPAKVQLVGAGAHLSTIYLADESNCTMIQSAGFGSLTGTNTHLVSAGVPHGFGLSKIKIHGNKGKNPQAPVTVKWYGKGFTLFDVIICNGKGGGLYSECAFAGGQQDTEGADAPESVVYQLTIQRCHGHGWEHRGPHDMRADQLFIMGCKNPDASAARADLCRALYVRSLKDRFQASGDFGFAHLYDSDIGFEAENGVNFRFGVLITETSRYEGAVIHSLGAQIALLKAYKNWRSRRATTTDSSVIVGGLNIAIASAQIRTDHGGNGLALNGADCQITAVVNGANTGGTGVVVDGSRNQLQLNVTNFPSGIGVDFAPATARHRNNIQLAVGGCGIGLKETTAGSAMNTIVGSCNGNAIDVSGNFAGNTVMVYASDTTGVSQLSGFTSPVIPAVDDQTNCGSASARWRTVHAASGFELRDSAGQTHPTTRLSKRGLEFGAGGSSTLDCRIDRQAAGIIRCYDRFLADSGLSVGDLDSTVTRLAPGQIAVGGEPISTKVSVPATACSGGKPGQWATDGISLYVCIASDTWVKATGIFGPW